MDATERGVSIAVSPVDRPGAPVHTWGSLATTFSKVRELGYESVELLLRHPADAPDLADLLDAHALDLRCILTGPAMAVDGLSLALESSADAAVDRVFDHIRLASEHRAAVVLGWMTGVPMEVGGGTTSIPDATLTRSLTEVGQFAHDHGVRLLIEPLSRDEPGAARTVDDALALCQAMGEPFGIVLDVFHLNKEEPDIPQAVARVAHAVEHVQIADTNRETPGRGEMDFDGLFETLLSNGFRGTVGIEALPIPNPDAAARSAMTFVRANDWTRRIAWPDGEERRPEAERERSSNG